jgi:hypothetical protein
MSLFVHYWGVDSQVDETILTRLSLYQAEWILIVQTTVSLTFSFLEMHILVLNSRDEFLHCQIHLLFRSLFRTFFDLRKYCRAFAGASTFGWRLSLLPLNLSSA